VIYPIICCENLENLMAKMLARYARIIYLEHTLILGYQGSFACHILRKHSSFVGREGHEEVEQC